MWLPQSKYYYKMQFLYNSTEFIIYHRYIIHEMLECQNVNDNIHFVIKWIQQKLNIQMQLLNVTNMYEPCDQ